MTRSGQRLGRYVLSSLLGEGGMGAVYLARDTELDRDVALKIIAPQLARDPSFASRFVREMRIAATLEHPNIVPVYEAGEIDGTLFIAMRRVDGVTLEEEISASGALSVPRVVRIARQLGSALDSAHRRGLVHRDVKSANVLLTGCGEDEHAYLADFGLAREAASNSGVTQSGQWIGTLDFIAPEILDGDEASARSDVYSLSCLLFQALTGEVPYPGAMARKLAGHANDPLPSVGRSLSCGAQIDAVLGRGAAKNPAHRFGSASDLARALGSAASSVPTSGPVTRAPSAMRPATAHASIRAVPGETVLDEVRPPAAPKHSKPGGSKSPRSTRGMMVAGVLAALLAVGAGAALLLGSKSDDSPDAGSTGATTPVATPSEPDGGGGGEFKKQASAIAASAQPSLDGLAAAARTTTPTSDASLRILRTSAERAISEVGRAIVELRALDIATDDRAAASSLEAALEADADLARALAAKRLSTVELEALSVAADSATSSLTITALPTIEVDNLIAALKRAREKASERDGDGSNESADDPTPLPAFRLYGGYGYEASIPTGPGWSDPVDSEPVDGRIFRTIVSGPDGILVLIDYTPSDPAVFGKDYISRRPIAWPFGPATEYVFRGSKIPECDDSTCVDIIMNDSTSEVGFAVLSGGGDDLTLTRSLARRVAESLVPGEDG